MRVGRALVVVLAFATSACGREGFHAGGAQDSRIPSDRPLPSSTSFPADHTDTGFGIAGRMATPFTGDSFAMRAAVAANDSILVVGAMQPDSTRTDTALARYTRDGKLDPSLALTGWVRIDAGKGTSDFALSVALLPDGRSLVGGAAYHSNHPVATVSRLTAGGAMDATFGTNGTLTLSFGYTDSEATGILLDSDGSAYVGIDANANGANLWAVAHILANGRLDTAFGTGSRAEQYLDPTYQQAELDDLCFAGGGIVLLGSVHDDVKLLKFGRDGIVDAGFAGGAPSFPLPVKASMWGVTAAANGGVILTGAAQTAGNPNAWDILVMKTTSSGELDSTFGNAGVVIEDLGSTYEWSARAIENADGSMFVGGTSNGLGVLRLLEDGSADATWGPNGWYVSSKANMQDDATDMVKLSDGRLVVVATNYDAPISFVLSAFR